MCRHCSTYRRHWSDCCCVTALSVICWFHHYVCLHQGNFLSAGFFLLKFFRNNSEGTCSTFSQVTSTSPSWKTHSDANCTLTAGAEWELTAYKNQAVKQIADFMERLQCARRGEWVREKWQRLDNVFFSQDSPCVTMRWWSDLCRDVQTDKQTQVTNIWPSVKSGLCGIQHSETQWSLCATGFFKSVSTFLRNHFQKLWFNLWVVKNPSSAQLVT